MADKWDIQLALLANYSSTALQYSGFVIAYAVGLFAVISVANEIPSPLVWGAVAGVLSSGLLAFESYLYLVSVQHRIMEYPPPDDLLSGKNPLSDLRGLYEGKSREVLAEGHFGRFRSRRLGKFRLARREKWYLRIDVFAPSLAGAVVLITAILKL